MHHHVAFNIIKCCVCYFQISSRLSVFSSVVQSLLLEARAVLPRSIVIEAGTPQLPFASDFALLCRRRFLLATCIMSEDRRLRCIEGFGLSCVMVCLLWSAAKVVLPMA